MSAADGGARVVARGLRREHAGGIVAVDDVSLELEPGEFVALTGPSGSGKSSLLSLLGALDRPDAGTVEVDGAIVSGRGQHARYHRDVVGFVFQHHHLLPRLDACGNVELPLLAAGVERRERRRRALALLAEMGLGQRCESLAAKLSGGERQRVAVARALANDPRLLLADEPTGSLDSAAAKVVLECIEQARARRGMTMLIVTYDALIAEHADRVLHLRNGRLVESAENVLRA
ncbi:MAG TPA: ATP-binding cassette domain-containing protein [Solirubrobacteraceae bacterium]|nr:ATP-binding cassette domain-containing protein [Solirubrobacteraceae bacterium]